MGRRLSPTAVYNYPNIAAMARWLAGPRYGRRVARQVFQPRIRAESRCGPDLDDVRNMTEEDIKAFILQEMAKP